MNLNARMRMALALIHLNAHQLKASLAHHKAPAVAPRRAVSSVAVASDDWENF